MELADLYNDYAAHFQVHSAHFGALLHGLCAQLAHVGMWAAGSPVRLHSSQLWGLCLEMVDVAGYSDPEYVRQLWDVHLKATVDAAAQSGGAPDPGSGASAVQPAV